MAHHRRTVGAATILNTAISVGEAAAAAYSGSLSLLADSIHNLSDELALVCLYGAFVLPGHLAKQSQRTANLLNSAGLLVLSTGLVWEAIERLREPSPLRGAVPMIAGLAAAAANWGVAWLLRGPAQQNAAIRLAYLHNLGDVGVSLAPVVAGMMVLLTGRPVFDPLVALAISAWLMASTAREFLMSRDALLWPEERTCGHEEAASARS
jgi:cation diffusion facilitator family transporter